MQNILVSITGTELDFDSARGMAFSLAEKGNKDTSLVAWHDGIKQKHSPCCVRCELGGRPGWEVYGENHQGRLMIIFNDRQYVFIHT
ncbi:MAG: AF1514 family protein [Desulfobulbaceae bacterium]|nr:AF1514 family protein [Desulfobulbaceae bacterium]HIJ77984.1 AF1514 family protein [Deltaproteobacteria bacterium]